MQKNTKAPASAVKRVAPGPKPARLKIKGDWEKAVTRSFKKKKPLGGWPK